MSVDETPSPATRDTLRVVVALALLAAPLWAPMLHLSGPTDHYERAEVVVDGDGIAYANDSDVRGDLLISEEIACSSTYDVRLCALEGLVAENATVPTGVHTSNPDSNTRHLFGERYPYAIVDDAVYETTYVANRSVQNENGMYRLDLGLERTDPESVLRHVSVRASDDDLPDVIREAARDGSADAATDVDVEIPETPIRLESDNGDEDGTDTYYRVYSSGSTDDTTPLLWAIDRLLTYVAPLVGLALLAGVWSRLEVTYVGDGD
ncbi:hypothetical protein OB955_16860 [Halobacteria archaeon AArc-m2/3/4]|uniref:DUF3068 domain-containing protein n=1 Tax=Natronoglomus mannanivorans TaxID=2979990 RepID=A0ABT2QHI4_9EURY|nr:hypothetical protein [Halobacteria archaeon AArc-m2/3/4]